MLSYNLIEEGVVSYLKISTVNEVIRPVGSSTWRYDVLKWLNFFGKLSFPIRFFSPGYRKVYGLSSFSFPEYARRVELPSPFVNSTESVQYRHVLALDASAENGLTTCESIRFALEKSIEWLIQENVDELWVKYHPEQLINAAVYSFYKEIFSSYTNRITIKEMPQQVCLELIAGNQKLKELTFYVFISSVGIYASMCDRKVYSFANFIVEVDENYTKTLNNLPKVFRESVKFIQAAGEEA